MKTTIRINAKMQYRQLNFQDAKLAELGFERNVKTYIENPEFDEMNMLSSDIPATIDLSHDELEIIISWTGNENAVVNNFYKIK